MFYHLFVNYLRLYTKTVKNNFWQRIFAVFVFKNFVYDYHYYFLAFENQNGFWYYLSVPDKYRKNYYYIFLSFMVFKKGPWLSTWRLRERDWKSKCISLFFEKGNCHITTTTRKEKVPFSLWYCWVGKKPDWMVTQKWQQPWKAGLSRFSIKSLIHLPC